MSSELIKEENGIVFIQKDNVFTNSKIIADELDVKHHSIIKMIKKYENYFSRFGKVEFMDLKSINPKGGRPEKICLLNEPQTTFLLQRVRGDKKVIDFQANLTQQFYLMREELRKLQTAKTIFLEARRTLTDSINALPESGHKGRKYKHYTDLLYKIVIGKNAAQIRKELGLGEGQSVVGFLSAEQYNEISKLEEQAAMLIDMGFEYEQIKSGLYKMYEKMKNNKLLPDQTRLVGV